MVTSQERYPCRPSCFQCQQQAESFQTVISSIHKITLDRNEEEFEPKKTVDQALRKQRTYHKYIISVRQLPTGLQQPEQIVKLAVNVSTNRDRCLEHLNVGFLQQSPFHLQQHRQQGLSFKNKALIMLADKH